MRSDDPNIARTFGLIGAAAIVFGGMALLLQSTGRPTPMGFGWAAFLLMAGMGALLFHAAFDADIQIRRLYMAFGY